MRPDNRVYEAATKLLSPEMKPFLDWVEAERTEILEAMSTAPAGAFQIMQGQAQAYKKILETVRQSKDISLLGKVKEYLKV